MPEIRSPDGTLIACASAGSGPPLLLVHGSNASADSWQPVLPALTRSFTVFCMDRRGHGESGDTSPYRIEREYEDIAACIAAIGKGPIAVAGHSYGGLCALGAARAGAAIGRLVLFEPPIPTYPEAYYPEGLIGTMRAALAGGDCEGAMEAFSMAVFRVSEKEIADMKKMAMWKMMARSAPIFLRELEAVDAFALDAHDYRGWSIPSLLVLGGDSPPQYGATIEALHDALPDSKIAVLKGQKHGAVKAAPDLFARTIGKFLKSGTRLKPKAVRLPKTRGRKARGA